MVIFDIYRVVPIVMLVLGLVSLLGSAFYVNYVLAFIGLGLTFWGALLLYLKSSKYVRLELLTATAASAISDIERILVNAKSNEKGVYLPPKRLLARYESSLVFIPSETGKPLPEPNEVSDEKLYSDSPNGIFLTPPGLALSRLFERKLGKSFTEATLDDLQQLLPRLFEELEITKNLSISIGGDTVAVEVINHIFKDLCEETRKLPKTHETVGCPFSSAIACALAKAAGKPVTIQQETQNPDGSTRIQYQLLKE
jgi:hypothetical protein